MQPVGKIYWQPFQQLNIFNVLIKLLKIIHFWNDIFMIPSMYLNYNYSACEKKAIYLLNLSGLWRSAPVPPWPSWSLATASQPREENVNNRPVFIRTIIWFTSQVGLVFPFFHTLSGTLVSILTVSGNIDSLYTITDMGFTKKQQICHYLLPLTLHFSKSVPNDWSSDFRRLWPSFMLIFWWSVVIFKLYRKQIKPLFTFITLERTTRIFQNNSPSEFHWWDKVSHRILWMRVCKWRIFEIWKE